MEAPMGRFFFLRKTRNLIQIKDRCKGKSDNGINKSKEEIFMKQAIIQLETLTCPSCIKKIETALGRMDGVSGVKVQFHSSKVQVDYDEGTIVASKLQQVLTQLGYPVLRMSERELWSI
jgi:copper chaperone